MLKNLVFYLNAMKIYDDEDQWPWWATPIIAVGVVCFAAWDTVEDILDAKR